MTETKKTVDQLTPQEALNWLIINDREGADFWKSCEVNADLVLAVLDNVSDFGYDGQRGDIEVIPSNKERKQIAYNILGKTNNPIPMTENQTH